MAAETALSCFCQSQCSVYVVPAGVIRVRVFKELNLLADTMSVTGSVIPVIDHSVKKMCIV